MTKTNYGPLPPEDLANLELARDWVKSHFNEGAEPAYAELGVKLQMLAVILERGWVQQDQSAELEALGVTLGDALAQELSLEWVMAEDEHGRAPALHWPGATLFCHPLDMIARRVEEGETFYIDELFQELCARLRELAASEPPAAS